MGTSSANWKGIVHRNIGGAFDVVFNYHRGDQQIDTSSGQIDHAAWTSIRAEVVANDETAFRAEMAAALGSWWTGLPTEAKDCAWLWARDLIVL